MRKEKLEEIKSYLEKLTIISKTEPTITEGKFLKIASASYTLANNKTIIREELIKPHDGAAIIFPITKEGNVVLIAEPRVLTKEGVTIELPAGYIDKGEQGIDAALRELEEETGYTTKEPLIYLGSFYQDQGCSRCQNVAYLALDCENKYMQHFDQDEFIISFECTLKETLELIKMNYIKSANSLLSVKLGENKAKKYVKMKKKEGSTC